MTDKKKNGLNSSLESVATANERQTASGLGSVKKKGPDTDEFTRLSDLEAADGYVSETLNKKKKQPEQSLNLSAEDVSPIQKDLAAAYRETALVDEHSQHSEVEDDIKIKSTNTIAEDKKDTTGLGSTSEGHVTTSTEDRAQQLVEEIVPESIRNQHPEVVKRLIEKAQAVASTELDDDFSSLTALNAQEKKMRDAVYTEIQQEYSDIIPVESLHVGASVEKLVTDTVVNTSADIGTAPKTGLDKRTGSDLVTPTGLGKDDDLDSILGTANYSDTSSSLATDLANNTEHDTDTELDTVTASDSDSEAITMVNGIPVVGVSSEEDDTVSETDEDTIKMVNGIPMVGVSSKEVSTKTSVKGTTLTKTSKNSQDEEKTATSQGKEKTATGEATADNSTLHSSNSSAATAGSLGGFSQETDSQEDNLLTSIISGQTSDTSSDSVKKTMMMNLPDGVSSLGDRTDVMAGGTAAVQAKAQGKGTGATVKEGLNASGIGNTSMSDVADSIEHQSGLAGKFAEDELDMLRESGLTVGETAGAAAAGAAMYGGEITPDNVSTVVDTAVKAAPAIKNYRKKKRKRFIKMILTLLIVIVLIVVIFLTFIIPPIISAVLSVIEDQTKNSTTNKEYTYIDGQPIEVELTGGISVDYAELIAKYQEEYDNAETNDKRYEAAGKLAYTQLFQLLDTASLETRHPLVLLGVAMAIRETSTFSASPASWAKNKIDGNLREGIYGVYFNKYINGVPSSGAGGSYEHDDGHYNLGAKGPLQIECDRYVLYTTNADGSISITKDEAATSIPAYDSSVVSYMPYVSADKSHIVPLKNNPTYANVLFTKVGHPNYISDYSAYIQTVDIFKKENGYMFPNRFQDSSTAFNDFAISLESVPNAFLLMTSYMVSNWPAQKFDELSNVFDNISDKTLLDRNISAYGYTLETTFKNEVAYEVYWTLCMLQRWNFGSNGFQYGSDSIVHQMDRLFVEVSNFVATNGLAALYDQCSGVIGNNYCTPEEKEAYDSLINFVCTANGTDPTDLIAKHDAYVDKNTSKDKTPYGYAISGLLSAYYYGNKQAVEVLGLTSFDISNYGGTTPGGTTVGGAGSYDSTVNYSGSHEVKTDLPCGTKGEHVVYYYTASGEKRWLDSSNWCSMFDPAQTYKTTSHFTEIGSGEVHAKGHSGVDTIAKAGYWMTYTIADCKVIGITRSDIGYHNNIYKRIGSSGEVLNTYNYNPGNYDSSGTSITYQLLDGSGLIVTQKHLRPGCLNDINVGDILPQGMAIGYASTTGHSTGTHSHTEFKIVTPDAAKPDGMKLNAEPFMNSRVTLSNYAEITKEDEFRQNGLTN